MNLPESAPGVESERLLGAWYVLATNHGFWRGRTHARVEYDALSSQPGAGGKGSLHVRETRRFRRPDLLGRPQRRFVVGTGVADQPGQFRWRGQGLRRVLEQGSSAVIVDPDYRWVVVWRDGGGTAGLGIHTRDPWIPNTQLDAILDAIRGHPFLGAADRRGGPRRCDQLFAPPQDWIPPQAYTLSER